MTNRKEVLRVGKKVKPNYAKSKPPVKKPAKKQPWV